MGSADTPPPPNNDPGKDLLKYVNGLQTALPSVYSLESQYRPEFGNLNLADINRMLNGTSSQAGIYGIGGQATEQSQAQLDAARRAEIASMQGNTAGALDVLGGINPTGQRAVAGQGALADQAYARATGPLSMQDARMADQTAREAFSARGRVNDNAAVSAEILGREDVMAARRQEASQLGSQSLQMSQQFTDPAMGILTGSPASVLLGQDYLNQGRGAVGSAVPQLIDTGAGITLGQQNASNLANWQSNVAAANNAQSAQNTQTGAAVASTALMALAMFSDKRLKKDIKKVGKTDGGLPVYTYKMKGSNKTQMGVMAQDVEKEQPDAYAILSGGAKGVRYDKIK